MDRKIIYAGFFILLFGCNAPKPDHQENTETNDEEITRGTLKSVGMDSMVINKMTEVIVSNEYPNIHSVLIAKNGKLVYENYFPGEDEIWGTPLGVVPHTKDSLHDMRSVSKSVVSACIGIAIAQGKIKSEEQKVWDFFPELKELNTGEKSNLTIKHLLTMSSGLEWNENIPYTDPANSEIQMVQSDDAVKYVLSRPLVNPPGTKWNYNGGCTQVLAAIIQKVSNLEVDQYAKEYLFKPLGIDRFFWTRFTSPSTKNGIPAAASGLRLRSRDMLKFGILYMNKGTWNGTPILQERWVQDSHKSSISRGDSLIGYGYQFWIDKNYINSKPLQRAVAVGNGNQRIFFDYENDLLVVTTAGLYNQWNIEKNSEALLMNYIYPAFIK